VNENIHNNNSYNSLYRIFRLRNNKTHSAKCTRALRQVYLGIELGVWTACTFLTFRKSYTWDYLRVDRCLEQCWCQGFDTQGRGQGRGLENNWSSRILGPGQGLSSRTTTL